MNKTIWCIIVVLTVASGAAVYSGNDRAIGIMALAVSLAAIFITQFRDWNLPSTKTLDGFCWRRTVSILYGTMMVFASLQFVSVVAALMLLLHGEFLSPIVTYLVTQGEPVDSERLLTQLAVEKLIFEQLIRPFNLTLFIFLGSPLLYFCGRRMGRRSSLSMTTISGMIDVLAATILAVLISVGLNVLVLGGEGIIDQVRNVQEAGQAMNDEHMELIITLLYALAAVLFFSSPLSGYWRGRRQTVGVYVNYVLRGRSVSERLAVANIAHQRATQAAEP